MQGKEGRRPACYIQKISQLSYLSRDSHHAAAVTRVAARFDQVDRVGKVVFTISLMAIAAATVLLLGPAAYHRLADRQDRRGRLRYGVRLALAGMALLGLSISCAVFVVGRFLFNDMRVGAGLAMATAVTAGAVWYAIPVTRRWRSGGISERQSRD